MTENKNEYDVNFATPTEKMTSDMSLLKEVGSFAEIGDEERQKAEEQIANIAGSIMSDIGGNADPSKLKENAEILKELGAKGFGKATEVLSMLDSISKETTGVGLDAFVQTASGMDKMARGIENENLTQTLDGTVQTGIGAGQIYAGMNGMGPEANAVAQMAEEGHLKETLTDLSNYGKGPVPEKDNSVGVPAILAEKGKENVDNAVNKTAEASALLAAKRQGGR